MAKTCEVCMRFWPTRTDSHAVSHFKELWGLGPTPGKYSHIIPFFLGGGLFAELSFFHRARLHEEQAAMCWTLDLKQCKYVVDPKTKGSHNFLPRNGQLDCTCLSSFTKPNKFQQFLDQCSYTGKNEALSLQLTRSDHSFLPSTITA